MIKEKVPTEVLGCVNNSKKSASVPFTYSFFSTMETEKSLFLARENQP